MIIKLHNLFIENKIVKFFFTGLLFLFVLIFPLALQAQVTFTKAPIDKQLYARDSNNEGTVVFEGEVSNAGLPTYSEIGFEVRRIDTLGTSTLINTVQQSITYVNNVVAFSFNISINSELASYEFDMFGIVGNTKDKNIVANPVATDIVAGDVYIIQGQSNAIAAKKEGSASNYENNFIRVYGSGNKHSDKLITDSTHRVWNIADGDSDTSIPGGIGQWGVVLANKIITDHSFPVAIFNGATGAKPIKYFKKDYDNSSDPEDSLNNYERMLYRLNITELKDKVKAIIWSQGESEPSLNTSLSILGYINDFTAIRNAWLLDYPSAQKKYIFQTKSSCGPNGDAKIIKVKEAQRQLAEGDNNIDLIQTTGLDYATGEKCHFRFSNGYEKFGTRIYKLIDRDFYGGTYNRDINTPMLTDAYLTSNTTLVVETDAINLSDNNIPVSKFILENAGGASETGLSVSGNKINFQLSKNPGLNATISYLGLNDSINSTNLITNSKGIEIVCFDKYPIDGSLNTVWDGTKWSHNAPVSTMNAEIKGDYNTSNGNISTNNLTINSNKNLNFDNGTINSVEVYGDLSINGSGSFTIGDKESLVMYNDNANISGIITKKESSTPSNDIHDITYWSSPVENETIGNVFIGVDPNRIFYYDQSKSTETDEGVGNYWDVWQLADTNMIMNPGQGFAAEGTTPTGTHNITFTGKPNNGSISIPIVFQNPGNDYNLIGNPYPSAINVNDFFDENMNVIDEVIYLWTHATTISSAGDFVSSDYASFNRTGGTASANGGAKPRDTLGSSQGFFVIAKSLSSVIFKNYMRRANQNDQFFKTAISKNKTDEIEKDRIWLDLKTNQGGFNQILIGFSDKATDGLDNGYDALRFDSDNPINFYSQIGDKKYVIQGLNTFSEDKSVTLGFDINVAPRMMTIGIDKKEGILKNSQIFLVDHLLNITHDLNQSDYQFEQTEAGEFLNRFTLKFTGTILGVEVVKNINNFTVLNTDYGFKIHANQIINDVKVYDILGRQLFQITPNQKNFVINIPGIKKGSILIFKATFHNNAVLSRKMIKI